MLKEHTSAVYPADKLAPPRLRHAQTEGDLGLPPGTEVFSADSHFCMPEDIWYERFPARLKDRAPRVWVNDGVCHIGFNGKSLYQDSFVDLFRQFETVPGCMSTNLEARMRDLDAEGVSKELVFPANVLALLYYPDAEIRELCFRIYNEYAAELQARAPGRFYAVGLINWWDAAGARRTLGELQSLGLKTFLLPRNCGKDADGVELEYSSSAMTPVWEEIERAGLPVAHHIGEGAAPKVAQNAIALGFFQAVAPFREMFGKYIFGGILDRHPSLQIGWFEGGISWMPTTMQDARHTYASYDHAIDHKLKHEPEYYWREHMYASFMIDPLGLRLIDIIGEDKAMWSSDYPHNESSFGYSRNSIRHVAKTVGPERARKIVSDNVKRFLKL